MASTRQWNKYINNLAIIFIIFFVSCSDSNDKFNFVLKSFSNNNDNATISFKNLDNNKTTTESIKTFKSLALDIDLNSNYSIKYTNSTSDIFGYINKIKPNDYNNKNVFLTLNKNKNFRQLVYIINDTIRSNEHYYYLYANNSIYRALGNSFKKLSLVSLEDKDINESFNIADNKVINLNGEYLINNKEIAFINKNNELKFIAHNIVNLNFLNTKYVKMDNDYFLIFDKGDSNYDCVRFNKQINDEIKVNQVNDCIQENISTNSKLLVKNNEFYLWDTDKLYKYSNSKFSLLHQFSNSGEIFQNNNNFYLISNDNFIYLLNIENNTATKLNLNPLVVNGVTVFDIDSTTTLITSKYWNPGENYYIFANTNSQVTLENYEFPDYMNLKNVVNIKIDNNQNIFLNNLSFESNGKTFNTVAFYLFSHFK